MSTGPTAKGTRLDWIEVGRGLAALLVVITHFDPWARGSLGLPDAFDLPRLGDYGVEYFFLLSGFIIFHAHGDEVGRPRMLVRYAWRRLVRIFGTYWLVLALSLIYNQTVQNPLTRLYIDPEFLIQQALILPGGGLLIGSAWTLRHELLFYTIFASAIVSRWLGLLLFGVWMAGVIAFFAINGAPHGYIQTPFFVALVHNNLDFPIGMATAIAWRRGLIREASLVAVALALLLGGATLATGSDAAAIFFRKALFAAILGGAVILSERDVPAPRALVTLGAASYALYLVHLLVKLGFYGLLHHLGLIDRMPLAELAGGAIASIVTALLLYRLVEKPLLRRAYRVRWAQRRDGPDPAPRPVNC